MLTTDCSAAYFLSRLFGPYPPDDTLRFEIRCVKRDCKAIQGWFPLTRDGFADAIEFATRLRDEYDIYYGVLPRTGRGASDADVSWAGWLWADIDIGEGTPQEVMALLVAAALPQPALIVASGSGGGHFYWPLSEPEPLPDAQRRQAFGTTLKRLCRAIGGASPAPHADTSCCNPSHVLRLPGTYNHKFSPPRTVGLWSSHKTDAAPILWWRANLPFEPVRVRTFQTERKTNGYGFGLPVKLIRWAATGYPEGKRHQDLSGAAKFIKRDCQLDNEDGHGLFIQKGSLSQGARRITREELESIWEWA